VCVVCVRERESCEIHVIIRYISPCVVGNKKGAIDIILVGSCESSFLSALNTSCLGSEHMTTTPCGLSVHSIYTKKEEYVPYSVTTTLPFVVSSRIARAQMGQAQQSTSTSSLVRLDSQASTPKSPPLTSLCAAGHPDHRRRAAYHTRSCSSSAALISRRHHGSVAQISQGGLIPGDD
jgi:hypothetical protein